LCAGDNWRTDHQKTVRENVLATISAWNGELVEPAFAEDADPEPESASKSAAAAKSDGAGAAAGAASVEFAERKVDGKADGAAAVADKLTADRGSSITQQIVDTCFQRVTDKVQKAHVAKRATTAEVVTAAAIVSGAS
jgi:creatinine amidohydrolase/Fe(II)-dependent formamide hydrolase-like protein